MEKQKINPIIAAAIKKHKKIKSRLFNKLKQKRMEQTTEKEQLVEHKQVPGTPFTLVKQNEKYFLAMGDCRLTDPTSNQETTLLKLQNEKWLILTNVIVIILDKMNQHAQIVNKMEEHKSYEKKMEEHKSYEKQPQDETPNNQ